MRMERAVASTLMSALCLCLVVACTKTEVAPDAGKKKRARAAATVKVEQAKPKPDTSKQVAVALDPNASEEARIQALKEIGTVGDPAAIYPLATALGVDHGDFEADIRATLDKLKAHETLCNDLDSGSDRLKQQASRIMFYLKDPRTFDSLEDALLDEDLTVRVQSASALRQLKDPRAVPALIGLLEHDAEVDARMAAAQALLVIGGDTADAALEKALQTEKDEHLKAMIDQALSAE
jgi:HEAT repeat protein